MNKNIVVANWKAYITSRTQTEKLFTSVCRAYTKLPQKTRPNLVLCVPFPYIGKFGVGGWKLGVALGVQNVFWETHGPYTGEVTTDMLCDAGATHVLIGHSERRKHLGETDEMVSKKVRAALEARLKIILCIGEWTRAHTPAEEKITRDFVKAQLTKAMTGVQKSSAKNIIITYEPVWAISGNKGEADTPENAAHMIAFIREVLTKLYDAKTAQHARVIYGGGVSEKNAASFTRQAGIDGVLVGAASTRPKEFAQIIKQASRNL